jgi:dolichyl-phosphate-mannose--protein O-mannosyl transferase
MFKKFIQAFLPGIVKPLHSLWNEILGFLFIAIAVLMIRALWRGYNEIDLSFAHMIKFVLGVFFFVVMLGFGLHAFWRARRISKS